MKKRTAKKPLSPSAPPEPVDPLARIFEEPITLKVLRVDCYETDHWTVDEVTRHVHALVDKVAAATTALANISIQIDMQNGSLFLSEYHRSVVMTLGDAYLRNLRDLTREAMEMIHTAALDAAIDRANGGGL